MLDEAAAVCSRSASQVKLKSLCSSESHAVSQQTLQIHINNGCKKKKEEQNKEPRKHYRKGKKKQKL